MIPIVGSGYRYLQGEKDPTSHVPDSWNVPTDVGAVVARMPGYAETPLLALPALARRLGLAELWVKDESHRFGLSSFKSVGTSYAIHRLLSARPASPGERSVFVAATAGNHGRAVAWASRTLGHRAIIYVPVGTTRARIRAIESEGAEVVVSDKSYDDTVRFVAEEAVRRGYTVVSDTAYDGNVAVPMCIMHGYTRLFEEAFTQISSRLPREAPRGDVSAFGYGPTALFIQAGVGSLLTSAAMALRGRKAHGLTKLISVEPERSDCLLAHAEAAGGAPLRTVVASPTIMTGLRCATPSGLAWPAIRSEIDAYLAIDDERARDAMRRLAEGEGGDAPIIAGASGAAGLAGLITLCTEPALSEARSELLPKGEARVLVVNTEGDIDGSEA